MQIILYDNYPVEQFPLSLEQLPNDNYPHWEIMIDFIVLCEEN